MKLPKVCLYPMAMRKQYTAKSGRSAEEIAAHFFLIEASTAYTKAWLIWTSSVGPNIHELVRFLAQLALSDAEAPESVQIVGEEQEDRFCKSNADMQGCAISAEGFKEYLERAISPRKQAWDKVAGMWVVPPALTPEEVACIEDTAKSIYAELTAPTSSTASESRRRPFYPSNGG